MSIGTSDGQYFENDYDYWHSQLTGGQQEEESKGESKMFLVRHGDTALNDENLVHGWVNTPLNDTGIDQAHKTAESLSNKNITKIVSSDIPRAKQTANIIGKKLGIPVTFDSNLRTWDSGDFDFTDKHEELKKYTRDLTKEPGYDASTDTYTKPQYAQAQPKDQKNVPTMVIPKEYFNPDHEADDPRIDALPEGHPDRRVFGRMTDEMQKEYDRLGIRPNDHFYLPDDPQKYRRMTPEESKNTDFDFIKVFPPDPNAPQANVAPPGSSETFNDFKDRILGAIGQHVETSGNTAIVTHSKAIKTMNAWEHAGYPEDDSIHMPTYHADVKPGGDEEMDANTVAALRQRNAVKPEGGRQEGAASQWLTNRAPEMLSQIGENIKDLVKHPENMVGAGNLTGMMGGQMAAREAGGALWMNLMRALKMERDVNHPSDIFRETGWYRDVDGHMKHVIDSTDAHVNTAMLDTDGVKDGNENYRYSIPDKGLKLSDFYYNAELYKRYPELKDYSVVRNVKHPEAGGYHNRDSREIGINDNSLHSDIQDVVHHEVQHYIQEKEGFEPGSSDRMFLNENPEWFKANDDFFAKSVDSDMAIGELRSKGPAWASTIDKGLEFMNAKGATHEDLSKWVEQGKEVPKQIRTFVRILKQHPDEYEAILEADKAHAHLKSIEEKAYQDYMNTYGEIEARTAEQYAKRPDWAKYYQKEGTTPRTIMEERILPENQRVSSPASYSRRTQPVLSPIKSKEGKPQVKDEYPESLREGANLEWIRRSAELGRTNEQIAKDLMTTPEYIAQTMSNAGIKRPVVPGPRTSHFSKIRSNEDDVKDIKKMYSEGKTYKEIAEYLGVTRSQIAGLIDRLGLSKRSPYNPNK